MSSEDGDNEMLARIRSRESCRVIADWLLACPSLTIAAVASFDEKFNRLRAEYAWLKVRICVLEDFGCLIKMLVN